MLFTCKIIQYHKSTIFQKTISFYMLAVFNIRFKCAYFYEINDFFIHLNHTVPRVTHNDSVFLVCTVHTPLFSSMAF